jgi:hypothetical protein
MPPKRTIAPLLLSVCLSATTLMAQSNAPATAFHASQLPSNGSVYAVDGNNQPLKIHASETKYNPHAAGNFARSFVYAGPQSSVEVEGVVSTTVLPTTTPILYVRINGDEPELIRNRVALVALGEDEKSRIIALYSANVFGGHHKRTMKEVKVTKSDTDDPQWLKLTPVGPLDPGPYAIVILPKDVLAIPDTVYDFNIPGVPKPKPE